MCPLLHHTYLNFATTPYLNPREIRALYEVMKLQGWIPWSDKYSWILLCKILVIGKTVPSTLLLQSSMYSWTLEDYTNEFRKTATYGLIVVFKKHPSKPAYLWNNSVDITEIYAHFYEKETWYWGNYKIVVSEWFISCFLHCGKSCFQVRGNFILNCYIYSVQYMEQNTVSIKRS